MELPITVMITLVVALLVGFVVIGFSEDLFSKADRQLDVAISADERDYIIEVPTVSSIQVAALLDDCHAKYVGQTVEDQICFVVLGEVAANEADVLSASDAPEDDITINLDEAQNAVRIAYDAMTDTVKVTG